MHGRLPQVRKGQGRGTGSRAEHSQQPQQDQIQPPLPRLLLPVRIIIAVIIVICPKYLTSLATNRGLEKALSTEHPLLVSTVILHSTVNLFQSEFPGSHVLIPTYIHAIGRILPETGHGAILRNACIRILGCFTCYPEHFARLIFSRNNTTIKKPLVKTYEEVQAAAACCRPAPPIH